MLPKNRINLINLVVRLTFDQWLFLVRSHVLLHINSDKIYAWFCPVCFSLKTTPPAHKICVSVGNFLFSVESLKTLHGNRKVKFLLPSSNGVGVGQQVSLRDYITCRLLTNEFLCLPISIITARKLLQTKAKTYGTRPSWYIHTFVRQHRVRKPP